MELVNTPEGDDELDQCNAEVFCFHSEGEDMIAVRLSVYLI